MEVLAIIGGIVSIAQAGDQPMNLLTKVKLLFDAPRDVHNLINDVFLLDCCFGWTTQGSSETRLSNLGPSP
jgi:hypothetical protein